MVLRSFALLGSLATGLAVHAQYSGIGLKGGGVASSIRSLQVQSSPLFGGTAGLYFPCGIGPRIELQPELSASTFGAAQVQQDGDRYELRSIYVQLPLFVKLYIGNGFNFSGGYQFGKPVSAVIRDAQGDRDILERYEALDHGFVFGLGVGTKRGLDVAVRAYSAMTPFLADDDALFPKHRSLQLTVGYRFLQFNNASLMRKRS